MAQPQSDVVGSLFLLNKALLKWYCYGIVVSSYLKLHKFHIEWYGVFFVGGGLQNSNDSNNFFSPLSGIYITDLIKYSL